MGEAPDVREQEDCPGPEVCGRSCDQHPAESAAPRRICWDENGGLHLPPEYAYIGVAMDRRDAADEMQLAFDGARRARAAPPAVPAPVECGGSNCPGASCRAR